MNPIDRRFAELRARGETALIPYLTVGDPDPAVTVELLKALQDAGADMIELGVPFSDPLADGPVIQRASARALARGTTLPVCLETARKAREAGVSVPLILFTYFNPALQMGLDLFFRRLADYDISGVILPDLPVEEDEEVAELAERYGIHRIPLVAPTSRERIARIVGRARGFVYCVSSLGVTGMRTDFYRDVERFLADVRSASTVPIAIGFGISNHEQVQRFSRLCDGVIVGSAIVARVEESMEELLSSDPGRRARGVSAIRDFVAGLKNRPRGET
ncbi:MAG: tryptophan synthase subunit alpha [Candidatus Reconcilbacillus cellulovorans]|uniref:Tryptophan synthase alpha chain n=1 Tax=Candidatus Reconcilbacillus cellulovorans TaxID=1906605 RepID=A0A2A6E4F7_9BACL|nr:MAG: tryptophan synthase subunit alpha [Candidatus Reconcilbacillus cellulovorans]